MVETDVVTNVEDFVETFTSSDTNDLDEAQATELWELWSSYEETFGDALLVSIPGWLSESELGKHRPFLFATVEYDDDDSGAVLFTDMRMIDVSVIKNRALTMSDAIDASDSVEDLDISGRNDYIDDPGMMWVPRSQMSVYERIGTSEPEPDETPPVSGGTGVLG